ncbi:YveK family protein [Luteococcus sp.]|uniref:YveK family protein n=1 Tax=Luteococcus sp. TaxID=1969402 RepID=UPI00373509DA
MVFSEWLKAFRRYWWIIALCTVLLGGLAGVITARTPAKFQSSSSVFFYVSAADNVTQLNEGTVYTQYQLQSWAKLVVSPTVLEPVVTELGLDSSASDLAERIEVEAPEQLTVLTLTVTAAEPDEAWKTAQAVARHLSGTVGKTIPKTDGGKIMIASNVISDSAPPATPSSPSMKINLLVGILGGLTTGCLLAAALHMTRERHPASIRDRDSIESGVATTTADKQ